MRNITCILTLLLAVLVSSCRTDEVVFPSESEEVEGPSPLSGGFYLMNEGNMGSNKCTIDYYDFSTGVYNRNIYAERNPNAVMELGDVGNDIAVYGSKLYAVVNGSHKVEVMDASTGVSLGKIDIPNCRYIKFHEGHAYVTSYIGPIGADPDCPLGAVFKVDTLTLTVADRVVVGYQPEEMEVMEDRLYVANSGGYRPPRFDNTISVIDLKTFRVVDTIEADINLHRLRKDRYDRLWATSRGNNTDIPSRLLMLEKDGGGVYHLAKTFDIPCSNIALKGDSLLYFSGVGSKPAYGVIDTRSLIKLDGSFIKDGTEGEITRPYALAVHPLTGDIFLSDAKNYVSSGVLYCFGPDGCKRWSVKTGDIPAALAFTSLGTSGQKPVDPSEPSNSPYISRVYEYCPAPGQFINMVPEYAAGDTPEIMARKCEEYLCGTSNTPVSLGAFGGYITFGFDHPVRNVRGEKDFRIWGNALWQSDEMRGGSCEPGIVMVSRDANGNGLPDDPWYELAGSEYNAAGTVKNYSITYHRPSGNGNGDILWEDSLGERGVIPVNTYHGQSYWPMWKNEASLTFRGTRLAPNARDMDGNGSNFVLFSLGWGYADNFPNRFADENSFDISWAVDSDGNYVDLPEIDFIRVYTGINQVCGWIGETSTEISQAADLHFLQSY